MTQLSLRKTDRSEAAAFLDGLYWLELEPADPVDVTRSRRVREDGTGSRIGRRDDLWRAGDVSVAVDAGCIWMAVVRDCDLDTVVIDPATFAAVAQSVERGAVALTADAPVSAEAAQLWETAFEYARQVATRPDLTPLVAGLTARMLAATALATSPTTRCSIRRSRTATTPTPPQSAEQSPSSSPTRTST